MSKLRNLLLGAALSCVSLASHAQTAKYAQPGSTDARSIVVHQCADLAGNVSSCGDASVPNWPTFQQALTTATIQILPARTGRAFYTLVNNTTSIMFVGNAGVLATTGELIPAGQSVTHPFSGAVYGGLVTGSGTISGSEGY